MKNIKFCKHALTKFKVLREHGFPVTKEQVLDALETADKTEKGLAGRIIAQKTIDAEHVLRVVFEKVNGKIVVITFYPGRRRYYEN